MNKAIFQQRLDEVEAEMDQSRNLVQQHSQAVNQLNLKLHILEGARLECSNWLKKLDENKAPE